MKVLVVGGGGREHAVIHKLKESTLVSEIFCAPGNGGISADAKCLSVEAKDIHGMVELAKNIKADLVVVTPDDPLALGMVDALESAGIMTFGPTAAAAKIESSKVFAKDLMTKYNIPTATHRCFSQKDEAQRYIKDLGKFPVVIKADGLALGKGVVICNNMDEAQNTIHSIMEDKIFGSSGNKIVIEEFLTGPEVSVLTFCDGKTIVPMVSSMDHKRALDGNKGANTGGMGAIAPNPHYSEAIAHICMEQIFLPTIKAMTTEGCPFSGCLYFGLMLTPEGPKVIEYNCRFGDPETQVVLSLLDCDLMEIMLAITRGELDHINVRWKKCSAACIVLASGGYPGKYNTGFSIDGLDSHGQIANVTIYHAGTTLKEGKFFTAGGRVLGITAVANSLDQAIKQAYTAANNITFAQCHMRSDIGRY